MEAARTSETLVNFYQTTRCYNPEDSNLHTHRRENLKSYEIFIFISLENFIVNSYSRIRNFNGPVQARTTFGLQILLQTSFQVTFNSVKKSGDETQGSAKRKQMIIRYLLLVHIVSSLALYDFGPVSR
jgi:hypothetical protein